MPSISSNAMSLETLRQFTIFNSLNSELLDMVIANIKIYTLSKGDYLFQINDSSDKQYFLLKGKVKLTTEKNLISYIEAAMPNSNHPLSRNHPREHNALALSNIEYFSINTSVLDELNRSVKKPADYLSLLARTHTIDDSGEALLHLFQHELKQGSFVLPSIPDIALKIRNMIDKPHCSASDLVAVVSTDPAIAAKLIQVANSPIYRGVTKCEDITSAITRLGMIVTKQLVTSFVILNLFNSESETLKSHMETLRCHSVEVAIYSRAIAQFLQGFNPEEALLAGLLHNIGSLVVLCYADRFVSLEKNDLLLSVLMHSLSPMVGSIVMTKWNFSTEQVVMVHESNNWLRDQRQPLDYCDVIIISKICAILKENAIDTLTMPSSFPVINRLQKQLSKEQILNAITQAQEQADDLKNLFSN